MSKNPNKLTRFWQELKRRKVFGVVTTYAATAYIIIEVVNNLLGPFRLPEWIPTLVAFLLVAGLPVVMILSWIFDITPSGIRKTESLEELAGKKIVTKPVKRRLRVSDIIIAVLLFAVVILAWPRIFKRDSLKRLASSGERLAVAVMPFQNMTSDTKWNVWQDGIQDMLINSLSNNPEELVIRQTESVTGLLESKDFATNATITPTIARTISQKLDANVFILGSIKQAGSTIRVNARLIDTKTKESLKSFQIEGPAKEDMVFHFIDSLSLQIKNFLILSKILNEQPFEERISYSTNNPDAYKYAILGDKAVSKGDSPTAIEMYKQAIAIDSNFIEATIFLAFQYQAKNSYEDAKKLCLNVYNKRDQMPMKFNIMSNWLHALLFETPQEAIKWNRQYLVFDNQVPVVLFLIGIDYINLYQFDKAIPELERALEICNRWDLIPDYEYYTLLGYAYHKTGQFKKEKKLYRKAEHKLPNNSAIIRRKAILALTEGDSIAANGYIYKYISLRNERSVSEADITAGVAGIYSEADILDKAEEYYRQALSLEPENPLRIFYLSWFLIDKDQNINEGMELTDKLLELSPNDYEYLDAKGWGLYKQKKFQEALYVLQKSWDLRREQAIYNHEAYLHLNEAEKAVAGLK